MKLNPWLCFEDIHSPLLQLDFDLHSADNLKKDVDGLKKAICGQLPQRLASPHDNVLSNLLTRVTQDDYEKQQESHSCDASKTDLTNNSFMLPDLNMAPSVDDYGPESFRGIS